MQVFLHDEAKIGFILSSYYIMRVLFDNVLLPLTNVISAVAN